MKNMKVAGYVRVSTSQQAETGTSIDDQIEKINNEATSRNLKSPIIYKDEGVSGKSTQRPALQNLLKDIKNGEFYAIIFTKLDRLARNLRDTLNLYHEADKQNVKMICLDNPVISTDGPMGSIMLQIMGAFAQFERDLIRSRTTAGRMHKWRNGQAMMGKLPFGYEFNKDTVRIEIVEKNSEVVKKIFSYYIDNRYSINDIAIILTKNCVPTPSKVQKRKDSSSSWNSTTVRDILKNESYTGVPKKYNQFKYKWTEGNKIYKSDEEKDESDWIVISLPAIIDSNTFQKAQSLTDHNKSKPKKQFYGYENKFIAENVLKCGHCHAKISKQTTGARNFIYYTCPWRRASKRQLELKNKNKCYLPFFDSDKIDKAVFNEITDLLSNPNEYAKEWMKDKPSEDFEKRILLLRDKSEKIMGNLSKILKLELNSNDKNIQEVYVKERKIIENEYTLVKRDLVIAENEFSFHENKVKNLNLIQKIFNQKDRSYSMKIKFKIKQMLNKLSPEEKKKLVNAVISPETGGCVYVKELTAQDLGLGTDKTTPTSEIAPHGNKVGERDFTLELDFIVDPSRIVDIIHAMDKTIFTVSGQ